MTDFILRIVEHPLVGQVNDFEVCPKECKVVRLQGGQEPVRAMIGIKAWS
jgi:hypothetical protein